MTIHLHENLQQILIGLFLSEAFLFTSRKRHETKASSNSKLLLFKSHEKVDKLSS